MFKKALLISALLTNGIAFAQCDLFLFDSEYFSGNFYAGAGISRDEGSLRFRNTDFGLNGINGDLFAGYEINWSERYYGALEIFGTVDSNKGNDAIFGVSLSQKSTIGIRILPGLKLTEDALVYADFGFVRGNFSTAGSINYGASLNGGQVGVGIQAMATDNASLRVGWNYNGFKSDPVIGSRNKVNQFYLDAIYHFIV